jgi:tRNA C32,U32 (ribose-2'-O)-methylase TrmJ
LKYTRLITIPSNPDYHRLSAVGICCYELHLGFEGRVESVAPIAAPFQLINAFYLGLEELCCGNRFILAVHTAESRMQRFRVLLDRAVSIRLHEMRAMLMGILRQMRSRTAETDHEMWVYIRESAHEVRS